MGQKVGRMLGPRVPRQYIGRLDKLPLRTLLAVESHRGIGRGLKGRVRREVVRRGLVGVARGTKEGKRQMEALYRTALETLKNPSERLRQELLSCEFSKVYGNAHKDPEAITQEMVWGFCEWSQARDTLRVWEGVANELEDYEIPTIERDDTLQSVRAKAAGFGKWLEENRQMVAKIRVLLLDECDLHTLPPELERVPNLEHLQLMENRLACLPSVVGKLPNLKLLWVKGNVLEELPAWIGDLEKLTLLVAEDNELQSLPKEIGNLGKLTLLGLGNNRLQSVPKEVGNMKRLMGLDLTGNQLETVPASVGELEDLEGVGLEDNPIKAVPQGLLDLGVGLRLEQNRRIPLKQPPS